VAEKKSGSARLGSRRDGLRARLRAVQFRACVADHIALAVETRNEHGAIVVIAARLIVGKERWLARFGGDVSQALAETTVAKLRGAAKELNGVVALNGARQATMVRKCLSQSGRMSVRMGESSILRLCGVTVASGHVANRNADDFLNIREASAVGQYFE
jgi:hypothetical protein